MSYLAKITSLLRKTSTGQEKSVSDKDHSWVDLGLSVKWATCNLGAQNPESFGDYYAWGETSTKKLYDNRNLKFCDADAGYFTKYTIESFFRGPIDNKRRLELIDDAANVNWGGRWRMPTLSEFEELINECKWTLTTLNGTAGYNVTSKKNGNSIFLPAAGNRNGDTLYDANVNGHYWSANVRTEKYKEGDEDLSYYAMKLWFDTEEKCIDISYYFRELGYSIRPVME